MTRKVKALVLTGNGVNAEMEMAHACRLAGPIWSISSISVNCFSGSGACLTILFEFAGRFLRRRWSGFGQSRGQPIFTRTDCRFKWDAHRRVYYNYCAGIDSGYLQRLPAYDKLGLLPALDGNFTRQSATLTFNDSGRFGDRWVYVKANAQSPCFLLKASMLSIIRAPRRR